VGGGDIGSNDSGERLMVLTGGWIKRELTTEKKRKVRSIIRKGYKWSFYGEERDQLAWVRSDVGRKKKQRHKEVRG